MNSALTLDRLYIASQCSADWNAMAGDERVRFCGECKLNVYNISSLTKPQAEELIRETEGRLCVRLFRRIDGTVLTKDCPVGLKLWRRRASRAAGAVLSAILTLLGGAPVAGSSRWEQGSARQVEQFRLKRGSIKSKNARVRGTIYDIHDAVIPSARITLVNERDKSGRTLVTDDEGSYKIENLEPGTYTIQIEVLGFSTFKKTDLIVKEGEDLTIDVTLEVATMGEVIFYPEPLNLLESPKENRR